MTFFPLSRFVHSVFKFYEVTPWMLITNLILFMSAFEEICRGWGFTPSLNLFRAFFKILKDNNRFFFCARYGLTIFSSHKDSIKHWVKSFAIVGAKGSLRVGDGPPMLEASLSSDYSKTLTSLSPLRK